MKNYLFFLFLCVLLFCYCSKKEFGNLITVDKFTSVKLLKKYPNNYINKIVKIKGRVVEESSDGFWINVQDEHFTVSVNFENEDFSLHSIISNNVIAIGRFVQTRDGYLIYGKYLKIIER